VKALEEVELRKGNVLVKRKSRVEGAKTLIGNEGIQAKVADAARQLLTRVCNFGAGGKTIDADRKRVGERGDVDEKNVTPFSGCHATISQGGETGGRFEGNTYRWNGIGKRESGVRTTACHSPDGWFEGRHHTWRYCLQW